MNWFQKVFSGSVDESRVNQIGIAVMAIGLLVVLLAPRIAGKIKKEETPNRNTVNAVKLVGLIICAAGALIAILA